MIKLFAPKEYWAVPEKIRNNWGCGPGGFGDWLVPDSILGISIKSACQIHDWYYRFYPGNSESDRELADRVFKNNMIRIVIGNTNNKWIKRMRLYLANIYFEAVRKFGGPSYFEERNKPEEYQ